MISAPWPLRARDVRGARPAASQEPEGRLDHAEGSRGGGADADPDWC